MSRKWPHPLAKTLSTPAITRGHHPAACCLCGPATCSHGEYMLEAWRHVTLRQPPDGVGNPQLLCNKRELAGPLHSSFSAVAARRPTRLSPQLPLFCHHACRTAARREWLRQEAQRQALEAAAVAGTQPEAIQTQQAGPSSQPGASSAAGGSAQLLLSPAFTRARTQPQALAELRALLEESQAGARRLHEQQQAIEETASQGWRELEQQASQVRRVGDAVRTYVGGAPDESKTAAIKHRGTQLSRLKAKMPRLLVMKRRLAAMEQHFGSDWLLPAANAYEQGLEEGLDLEDPQYFPDSELGSTAPGPSSQQQ